jgi:hypothetical protein
MNHFRTGLTKIKKKKYRLGFSVSGILYILYGVKYRGEGEKSCGLDFPKNLSLYAITVIF